MPSAYATTADMQARFEADELTQLTNGTTTPDGAVLQLALNQADATIDGYVSAYYRRIDAVDPVPPLLVDIACDVARYYLFRRASPTEHVKTRFEQRMRELRDIAAGRMKIDQGEETHAARDGQILIESSDRRFTRGSMEGL